MDKMDKPSRPKIKVKKEPVDWALESTGFIAILLLFGIPAYFYKDLPETIPLHFGLEGLPDNTGSKSNIWIVPGIGLVIYVGLAVLNRHPYIFSYPVKITRENAAEQYKKACRVIRLLNTIIAISFCYISYSTIMIAKGKKDSLGNYFIPVFIVLIFGVMGIYLYRSSRSQSK